MAPGHSHGGGGGHGDAHGGHDGGGHDGCGTKGHSHGGSGGLEAPLLGASKPTVAEEEQRKLKLAVYLALFFMCAEIFGGVLANSLAIITDAAHMLSDVGGFIVSLFCLQLAARGMTKEYTYGFKQAEVLGALLSISIVWALTACVLMTAVKRFYVLEEINAPYMFVISVLGVVVNIILMKVLGHSHGPGGGGCGHGHGGEGGEMDEEEASLAMKAAIAHVIGDIVQSVSVCIAALLIWTKPYDLGVTATGVDKWNYADPVCSFIFGILVLYTTVPTLKQAIRVLMVKAPAHVDQAALTKRLHGISGVVSTHDLHVWTIGSNDALCTAHIQVRGKDNMTQVLKEAIKAAQACGIYHSTFQLEIEGEFDHTSETYGIHDNPEAGASKGCCGGHDHGGSSHGKGDGHGHSHGESKV